MASYNYMMSADEVAQELNCSKSHAYKLVKAMNKELSAQGYITMAGRIPKAFWAKTVSYTHLKYVLCIGVMLLGIYMILTSERQEKQRKRANG